MVCQADNRFLNMRIRLNVAMNDPYYKMLMCIVNIQNYLNSKNC